MKQTLSISIGIPAFNEAGNISNLLTHLIKQKLMGCRIDRIMVVSDASTDQTVNLTKRIKDTRILVVDGKTRLGKAAQLNYIFKHTKSDLLITIDADSSPHDNRFIQKIVDSYLAQNNPALISVKVVPADNVHNLVSRIIAHSQFIKLSMFEKLRDTKPIYLCIGRAFGYSRSLYTQLVFPRGLIAEDAYACLYSLKYNLPIAYQDRAVIYYTPPSTINDHLKQSARYYNSESQLAKYFGADFVKSAYTISPAILLQNAMTGFINAPLLTLLYTLLLIYSKISVTFHWVKSSYLWDTARSSKQMEVHI